MELINRETIVEHLAVLADANRERKPEYSEFCEDLACFVEDMPFLDEHCIRAKGRWENVQGGFFAVGICSVCGTRQSTIGANFCSNCGADMRERKET